MAAIQFQDVHGVVNDPSTGREHLTPAGVYNEQAAAAPAAVTQGQQIVTNQAVQQAATW